MLARWLMAFCVVAGFLCLGEDARGFEVLPQSGSTSSTKVSGQSGFAGLTLSRQSTAKIGDSLRLITDSKPLRLGVLENASWGAGPEAMGQAGHDWVRGVSSRKTSGPKKQGISLVPRLLIGAGVTAGATLVIGGLVVVAFLVGAAYVYFFGAGWDGSDAVLVYSMVLTTAAALSLGVSWTVWKVGNRLGGEGSYIATLAATVLSVLVLAGTFAWYDENTIYDRRTQRYRRPGGIGGTLIVGSLFAPVAGYEISSHKRRQRRNYSVGISPVLATSPAAPMRVEGAALAIRGGF